MNSLDSLLYDLTTPFLKPYWVSSIVLSASPLCSGVVSPYSNARHSLTYPVLYNGARIPFLQTYGTSFLVSMYNLFSSDSVPSSKFIFCVKSFFLGAFPFLNLPRDLLIPSHLSSSLIDVPLYRSLLDFSQFRFSWKCLHHHSINSSYFVNIVQFLSMKFLISYYSYI